MNKKKFSFYILWKIQKDCCWLLGNFEASTGFIKKSSWYHFRAYFYSHYCRLSGMYEIEKKVSDSIRVMSIEL